MSKAIVLKETQPNGRKYVITGATHIGRSRGLYWQIKERPIPEEFYGLQMMIVVENSLNISRNHAGIVSYEDGYAVLDLNSMNGTFLNGSRVGTQKAALKEGDTVRFADDLELKTVGELHGTNNHYALLVGHDGGNLRGIIEDLEQMGAQLSKRGFGGNVEKLANERATKKNILGSMEKLAYLTAPETHFIFHYSGHGGSDGLSLGRETLSPAEIYEAVGNIRGKRAMIFDCCHAGVFLDDENKPKVPHGSLVLAASSRKGIAREGPDFRIAGGNYMGRFTSALVRYIDETRGPLNLRNFKDALELEFGKSGDVFSLHQSADPDAETKFVSYESVQKPQIIGSSFTMVSAESMRRYLSGKPIAIETDDSRTSA